VLTDFFQGYNCTVFAYGQTGSGESYTMFGPDSYLDQITSKEFTMQNFPLVGMIPRVVEEMFKRLIKQEADFTIRVSHVEVYNEDIYDLLEDNQEFREPLKIFEERTTNATQRNKIMIQNLTEILVKTPYDIIQLI